MRNGSGRLVSAGFAGVALDAGLSFADRLVDIGAVIHADDSFVVCFWHRASLTHGHLACGERLELMDVAPLWVTSPLSSGPIDVRLVCGEIGYVLPPNHLAEGLARWS